IFQYSLDNGGNQDRVFPENVQFTARNAHSLSPDGKFWLESITEFDPIEHSELMLSPNLLSEQGKELVGNSAATFKQDGYVKHAVMGDVEVVVSVNSTGTLRRWKKGNDKPVWEDKLGKFQATALTLCPKQKRIAVGGKNGEVRLYSVETGKTLATLAGHTK